MRSRFATGLLLLACLLMGPISGRAQQPTSETLVLLHANVIDGVSGEPIRDATMFVRDGKVERVATGQASVPPGAQVIDLQGRWLLPGFIDAHVHIRDLRAARLAVQSGATTVRSMGVDHFTDVGMRELHRGGVSDLPDFLAAGYHIRPRVADQLFLDAPTLKDLMGGVSGAENVRRLVRLMAEHGVDVLKVNATERAGLPDTDPRKRTFSDGELAALVDEARKAGLPVAAHAHGDEGARGAVRAGVRTVEHGTFLSDATLAEMKQRGTCLDPTIATVLDLIEPGGDYDNSVLSIRGRAMLPRIREVAAKAWKLGIPVITGTDTGYGPESRRRVPDEIAELVGVGMPPMDAIKSATSTVAQCLGIAGRTGTIRQGLEADLLVVERNPLENFDTLRDPVLVVINGKIAVNRLPQ